MKSILAITLSCLQKQVANGSVHLNVTSPPYDNLRDYHGFSRSNPGDVVLDHFARSGTTGQQALLLNRKFIGCEISPEYHALCVETCRNAAIPGQIFQTE